MLWLERTLAVALSLTALWLAFVLASEAGWLASALVVFLIALALVGLALMPARVAVPAAALLMMAALVAPGRVQAPVSEPAAAVADAQWRPFDRTLLTRLIGEGKVVMVDVTADWCLTCQVNKRLVLSRERVRRLLEEPGVVALRADWTRPDPAIADYLASHGRYGIPFNAVYGPGAPDGVLLPELLTEDAVIAAFEQAGRPKLAETKP
jgi:suppressor for copper-sensitivity B